MQGKDILLKTYVTVIDPFCCLSRLVTKFGKGNWSSISKQMGERSAKQCRERWLNHVQAGLVRRPWTQEEDSLLVVGHKKYGNKWAKIATMIAGKTENMVKNRM